MKPHYTLPSLRSCGEPEMGEAVAQMSNRLEAFSLGMDRAGISCPYCLIDWRTEMDYGNDNTLGNCNTLGDSLRYGGRLTVAGVKVRRLMTLANVDGSGRQVLVLAHTEGVKIECGCFSGTLDEFCARADSEGKKRYSRVVRAAVEAFVACLDEDGITGGWENGMSQVRRDYGVSA